MCSVSFKGKNHMAFFSVFDRKPIRHMITITQAVYDTNQIQKIIHARVYYENVEGKKMCLVCEGEHHTTSVSMDGLCSSSRENEQWVFGCGYGFVWATRKRKEAQMFLYLYGLGKRFRNATIFESIWRIVSRTAPPHQRRCSCPKHSLDVIQVGSVTSNAEQSGRHNLLERNDSRKPRKANTHTLPLFCAQRNTNTPRRDGYRISRIDFSVSFSHSIRPRCAFACHEQCIREVKKKQYRQSGELKWWTWNRNSTIFNCHQNSHIRQSGKKILRFVWTHRRNWTSTVVFSFVSFQTEQIFFWLVLHQHLCTENSTNTNKSVFDTFSLLLLLLSCLITIIESGVWIEIESKIRNLCNKQKQKTKNLSQKNMPKTVKAVSLWWNYWSRSTQRFHLSFYFENDLFAAFVTLLDFCVHLSLQFGWECENITILSFSDLYEKIMYEMVNTQFYFISLVSLSIWCQFKWIERLQVDRMFVCGRTSLKLLIFH